MSKQIWSKKQMDWSHAENSPVMKEMLENPEIAGVLDKGSKQQAVYDKLKEKSSGGISKDELKEVLTDLKESRGKLTSGEVDKLAHGFFPKVGFGESRFKRLQEKRSLDRKPTTNPTQGSSSQIKPTGSLSSLGSSGSSRYSGRSGLF